MYWKAFFWVVRKQHSVGKQIRSANFALAFSPNLFSGNPLCKQSSLAVCVVSVCCMGTRKATTHIRGVDSIIHGWSHGYGRRDGGHSFPHYKHTLIPGGNKKLAQHACARAREREQQMLHNSKLGKCTPNTREGNSPHLWQTGSKRREMSRQTERQRDTETSNSNAGNNGSYNNISRVTKSCVFARLSFHRRRRPGCGRV